jgi:hypothetical protein
LKLTWASGKDFTRLRGVGVTPLFGEEGSVRQCNHLISAETQ